MNRSPLLSLAPFWLFLLFFKFGGNIHYTLLSPLGEGFFNAEIAGIIIGLSSLIQLGLDIPAGLLLDRFGYIRMLRIGTIAMVITALSLAFIPGSLGFVVSALLSSLGWVFLAPGVNAYLLSSAPKEKVEQFMSTRDIFDASGVMLSALVISFMINSSQRMIGFSAAIVAGISFIFLLFTKKDKISVHEEIKTPHHFFYIRRNVFKGLVSAFKKLDSAGWLLLAHGLCSSALYAVIWFIIPLMIADPSKKIFGISLGIFDFAIIILGSLLGRLSKRMNYRVAVSSGLLIFAVMTAFLGFGTGWVFLIIGFLATAGEEFTNISLWSWLSKKDKDHQSDGAISGTISMFQDLGWTIGPIAAGFLYIAIGPEWTISIASMPIFLTFILSLAFSPKGKGIFEKEERLHPHKLRHKR